MFWTRPGDYGIVVSYLRFHSTGFEPLGRMTPCTDESILSDFSQGFSRVIIRLAGRVGSGEVSKTRGSGRVGSQEVRARNLTGRVGSGGFQASHGSP